MLEQLPLIWNFFTDMISRYWAVAAASSVLAGFLALAILDRIFNIFDIIRH